MRSLILGAVILCTACATPGPQPVTTPAEELSSEDLYELMIARARATFPEAKRRFLAGLPEGYVLIVGSERTLIVVDEIESGEIKGGTMSTRQFVSPDNSRIYERELTLWGIIKKDAAEGGLSRLVTGTRVTSVYTGAGATCSQAQAALESSTRNEARKACDRLPGPQDLCGDEGVWTLGSCQRKAGGKSYELQGFMYFGCCRCPADELWIYEIQ
jgi:hypothetical protein